MAEGDGGSSRNFRSSYYEKLGFCGNDEKNYLDMLIASSPFDPEKLSDLCEKFELGRKCIEAWKVLLNIECEKKSPFDEFANVRRVRAEHFESLRHHLEVLLRHNVVMKDRLRKCSTPPPAPTVDIHNKACNLNEIDKHPESLITLMYLLEAGRLDTSDIDSQLHSDHCRKLSAMATFFVNVSCDLQEAFFLFRNFTNILNKS